MLGKASGVDAPAIAASKRAGSAGAAADDAPLDAQRVVAIEGNTIVVAGSLRIAFADFGIEKPQAMLVLSVEDAAVMELLIHFTRCCG